MLKCLVTNWFQLQLDDTGLLSYTVVRMLTLATASTSTESGGPEGGKKASQTSTTSPGTPSSATTAFSSGGAVVGFNVAGLRTAAGVRVVVVQVAVIVHLGVTNLQDNGPLLLFCSCLLICLHEEKLRMWIMWTRGGKRKDHNKGSKVHE